MAVSFPVELQSVRFRQSLSLWERWHCVSNDGEGEPAALQASNAKAARPGGLAAFMLIKIFYSTSSSAKIHSTSLMWEPLREYGVTRMQKLRPSVLR